jgi:hypothetical protein
MEWLWIHLFGRKSGLLISFLWRLLASVSPLIAGPERPQGAAKVQVTCLRSGNHSMEVSACAVSEMVLWFG